MLTTAGDAFPTIGAKVATAPAGPGVSVGAVAIAAAAADGLAAKEWPDCAISSPRQPATSSPLIQIWRLYGIFIALSSNRFCFNGAPVRRSVSAPRRTYFFAAGLFSAIT